MLVRAAPAASAAIVPCIGIAPPINVVVVTNPVKISLTVSHDKTIR